MHTTPLATDVQRYLESCSPAGLTLLELDIVEDVAEFTLAFTPEALDRVLRTQLRAMLRACAEIMSRSSLNAPTRLS